MGIQVECPNGHTFKVKDKYAGKKGLCPHCEGQVIVQVPDVLSGHQRAKCCSARRSAAPGDASTSRPRPSSSGSHVFDDPTRSRRPSSGTSGSLLGSSVIRHNIKCKCGQHVPMWYARCPACWAVFGSLILLEPSSSSLVIQGTVPSEGGCSFPSRISRLRRRNALIRGLFKKRPALHAGREFVWGDLSHINPKS